MVKDDVMRFPAFFGVSKAMSWPFTFCVIQPG